MRYLMSNRGSVVPVVWLVLWLKTLRISCAWSPFLDVVSWIWIIPVSYAWLLSLVVECMKVIECQDRIILSRYHQSQYSSKLCSKKSLAKVDQIVREGVLHEILIMSMTHKDSILVWHLDRTIYMESGLLQDERLKSHGICRQKGPLVWEPYTVWGSWRSSLIQSMIDV